MAGLREQQRVIRREAIVTAASELFQKLGYEAATVELIAARATVSVPTIFKYFGSKQEIVLALLKDADIRAIRAAREQMPKFNDPVDSLCHFERLIAEYELQVIPSSVWRELLPHWYATPSDTFQQLNEFLVEEATAILRDLQNEGKLGQNFDPGFAAVFFNEYALLRFMRLTQEETPDLEAHSAHMRKVLTLLFQGFRP